MCIKMGHAWNPYYNEKMEYYYSENAKELHNLVHRILHKKIGGVVDKDLDHFYSIANDVFSEIVLKDSYDPSKGDFGGFLYKSIKNRIISDFYKTQNADKRKMKIEDRDENGNIIFENNSSLSSIGNPNVSQYKTFG